MANSSFAGESGGSLFAMPMLCRWEIPGRPLRIQLRLDLLDRLECEVVERFKAFTTRGSEIGGVLLGRIDQGAANRTITIEDCELVPCDYSRSPLYLLADDDRQRLQQTVGRYRTGTEALSVVGFFRSNTRRDLAVDDEDLGILHEYFANPDCVFLLVKPFASKPSMAAFFLWKGGEVHSQSELQFPFRRSELQKIVDKGLEGSAGRRTAAMAKPPLKYDSPQPEPMSQKAPTHVSASASPAATEMADRSIRILGPKPPALLVDSRMRAEWEQAAATRVGKLKEYLLWARQCFCPHPSLLWIENTAGVDKATGGSRSTWRCTACHARIHREFRQPYACQEAGLPQHCAGM